MICLWDGRGGDGPGGTRDMVNLVRGRTGFEPVINDPNGLEATPSG